MLGVDVLIDGGAGLRGGDLRVHVVVGMGALDLHDAAATVDIRVGLRALPTELGCVETVDVRPFAAGLTVLQFAAVLDVAVRRIDVGEIVFGGHVGDELRPLVVEITVDEVVRQAAHVRIRDGLHGTRGGCGRGFGAVGLRLGWDGTRSILSVLVVVKTVRPVEHDVIQ